METTTEKVDNSTIVQTLTIDELSTGSLSVKWNKVIHPLNGYTLADLSADLSNKIFIKDIGAPIESKYAEGTTSDLSIIKITKDKYEEIIATVDTPDQLCSNVLYVISADYMDVYGQVISNLAMTNYKDGDINIVAEAVNKSYVDTIITNLCSEIYKLSTSLSIGGGNLSVKLSTLTSLPDASDILINDVFLVSLYRPSSILGKNEYFSRKAKLSNIPIADSDNNGFMSSIDKNKLDSIESGATKYVLPKASATNLGGIKVGEGLAISDSGVLNVVKSGEYVLPTATSERLGGLKVGYKAEYTENKNNFALQLASETDVINKDKAFVEIPTFTDNSQFKAGLVNKPTSSETQKFLRGDGAWEMPPQTQIEVVTQDKDGLCPRLPLSDGTIKYLRGDGSWEKIPESKITFDDIYPVGSIYISVKRSLPEFFSLHGTWQRIAEGKCLFGSNSSGYYAEKKVGESVLPGIPKPSIECAYTQPVARTTVSLSELTTSEDGLHSHTYELATSGYKDCGDNGWHPYQTIITQSTSSAGSHRHSITGNATATTSLVGGSVTANVLQDDIYGKSSTVQPPALVVSMWQRTA